MTRTEELQKHQDYLRLRTRHANKAALVAFRAAHSEHLHAELDLYVEKDMKMTIAEAEMNKQTTTADAKKNKQTAATSTSRGEAGPSIICVEMSGLELDNAF
jgi:hypothetical protein